MEDSPAFTNSALIDETEVINAIYGPSTLSITTGNDGLRGLLHLPPLDYSFLLSFPITYPAAPPVIDGIDMLQAGASTAGKAALSTLRQSLSDIWTPDSTCLYDLIEHFNETSDPAKKPLAATQSSQNIPKQQVRIRPIDLDACQLTVACTACLDEGLNLDMGRLRCGHFYCGNCLHSESPDPKAKEVFGVLQRL